MKKFVLSLNQLRGAMPALPLARAAAYLPLINASLEEFQINDREEVCAYLANLGHESQDLTRQRENLNYSAQRLREVFGKKYFPTAASAQAVAHNPVEIANIVYGGRMGNHWPGDGWRYRGGGPIGSTGRDMYRDAGKALNLPLEQQPELVEKPEVGCRVAAWTWAVNKKCGDVAKQLRGVADPQEFKLLKQICVKINGGVNGLDDRVTRYARALKAIKGDSRPWPEERAPEPEEVQEWLNTEPQPLAPSNTQAAAPTENNIPSNSGDDLHADFSKLLKKDAVKQSAKVASVRGIALLWRPITLLITAIKTGNVIAISGTVLAAIVIIVAAVLYRREILNGLKWFWRQALELFSDAE